MLTAEELMLLNCGAGETLESPLDCKENKPCSLEGQILKLRLQYFGHLMRRLLGKDLDVGKV